MRLAGRIIRSILIALLTLRQQSLPGQLRQAATNDPPPGRALAGGGTSLLCGGILGDEVTVTRCPPRSAAPEGACRIAMRLPQSRARDGPDDGPNPCAEGAQDHHGELPAPDVVRRRRDGTGDNADQASNDGAHAETLGYRTTPIPGGMRCRIERACRLSRPYLYPAEDVLIARKTKVGWGCETACASPREFGLRFGLHRDRGALWRISNPMASMALAWCRFDGSSR
jgi:hypothetical protein